VSNPAWPSSLPQYPLNDGNTKYAPLFEPVLTTSMEVGAPKRRRRVTYIPETCNCNVLLTGAQWATLDTFLRTTIKEAGQFDWKDFRLNATATYVFKTRPQPVANAGEIDSWTVALDMLKVA
jgi:hypothetical protein